ncbi:MAG: hypothetical protein AAGJ31_10940, partial [Verrucomicrobiota bacterium]
KWDVYSFGVVAYQLITGSLPRLRSDSEEDLDATLLDQTLPEESWLQTRKRIVRQLYEEEEIHWPKHAKIDPRRKAIITRCLALDRNQRPSDMREVRNEILRQRQESRTIRSRNVSLLFGGISAVALAALGKASFEAGRAQRAIQQEHEAREEAEKLVNFIIYNLSENLDQSGRVELLEHIAENAETYFSRLPEGAQPTGTVRSFARLLETRGLSALTRGDAEQAVDAFHKAYNLLFQLDARHPDDSVASFRGMRIMSRLGDAQRMKGDEQAALAAYEMALEIRETEEFSEVEPSELLASVGQIYQKKAEVNAEREEWDEARGFLKQALEQHREACERQDGLYRNRYLAGWMKTLLLQAEIEQSTDRDSRAEECYQEVVSLGEGMEALPWRPRWQALLADAYRGLQGLETEAAEMRVFAGKELVLRESQQSQEPSEQEIFDFADCLVRVAQTKRVLDMEERKEAMALYERALFWLVRLPSSFRSEDRTTMEGEVQQAMAALQRDGGLGLQGPSTGETARAE